jgi:hypothetical protein
MKLQREYQDLLTQVNQIKPFKVIGKGRGYVPWHYNEEGNYVRAFYEENLTEGYNSSRVEKLVSEIENNSRLSTQEKIKLEEIISNSVTKEKSYDPNGRISRGALNILFMKGKNVTGVTRGHKLASYQGLKLHALVYTNYIERKKTVTIDGVFGSDEKVEEKKIYTWVLELTEYGKQESRRLARQGERVAYNDLKNLQKLGLI